MKHRLIFLMAALLLISCFSVSATPILMSPIGDAFVNQGNANTNYGTDDLLEVTSYSTSAEVDRSYLWFNVGGNVSSAVVRLYLDTIANCAASTKLVSVYYCDDYFDEDTITWNNQATEVTNCDSTAVSVLTCDVNNVWKTIDLANYTDNISNTHQFSLKIKFTAENANPGKASHYMSKENSNTAHIPYLNVTTTEPFLFYQCSLSPDLTFNIKDEETSAALTADFEATFDISFNSTYSINKSFDLSGSSSYSFCIYPENGTYNTDAIIQYGATGFDSRSYYFDNATLDNATDTINLYLLNSSSSSQVTVSLYDLVGTPLEGYFIKAYSYDAGAGTYTLVEMEKTSFTGKTNLNLILSTTYYKFIIEKDGVIYKETTPTKIFDTTLIFYLNLDTLIAEEFRDTMGIIYTFNFTGDYFDFLYDDTNNLVTSGCIDVFTVDGLGETQTNHSCVAASGGEVFVHVDNSTNTTYKGVAYVVLGGENIVLDTIYKTFTVVVVTFGVFGLFLTVIIVLTLSSVGFWSPPVALLLAPAGLIFTKIAGLHEIGWSVLVSILAVCAIIAYIISDRS